MKSSQVPSKTRRPFECSEFHEAPRDYEHRRKQSLLTGERTQIIRGRMPRALFTRAKNRTGIASDTGLIEVALASIAVGDDCPD